MIYLLAGFDGKCVVDFDPYQQARCCVMITCLFFVLIVLLVSLTGNQNKEAIISFTRLCTNDTNYRIHVTRD